MDKLNEREQTLLNIFRSVDLEGQFKIITACMNERDIFNAKNNPNSEEVSVK